MTTWILLTFFLQTTPSTEWTLPVRHDHDFGSCRGNLFISNESVRYQPSEGDHAREWRYPDIELFEIVSPTEIRIHSYESNSALKLWSDREFGFEFEDGMVDQTLYEFVRARNPRALRARLVFAADEAGASDGLVQELGARHSHLFGGCEGTLSIMDDRIVYRTPHPRDSRIWRLDDLESFASTDDFDLRLSTRNETFHFDLKVRLNRTAYEHLWNAVYAPRIQTYRGGVR